MLTYPRRIQLLTTVAITLAAAGCDRTPTGLVTPAEPALPVFTSPERDKVPFIWTPGEGMREIPLPAEAKWGEATGINYNGDVVGWYMRTDGDPQAFMWSERRGFRIIRVVVDMQGDLENVALYPVAINDRGQVLFAGSFRGTFVWQDGKVDFLAEWQPHLVGHGINSSGEVAGEEIGRVTEPGVDPNFADEPYNLVSRPFVWSISQGFRYLPSSGTDARTAAIAINDNGLVVGYSGLATKNLVQSSTPLMWGTAEGPPSKLSTRVRDSTCIPGWDPAKLPDNSCATLATAVNNTGEIAGTIERRAFRWSPDEALIMLPGPDGNSYATAINNLGDVAGFTSSVVQSEAFVWRRTGVVEKIGTLPGRSWSIAKAVNDRGQVVGNAQ